MAKRRSVKRRPTKKSSKNRPQPHPPDPIRIVPLFVPSALPHAMRDMAQAAAPRLTYRSGRLLSAVRVFTIFWGRAWTTAQAALVDQLNQFFDGILTGPLIDQLREYSVPKYAIKHGTRIGTATITTPSLQGTVTDAAIQKMLQQQIATGTRVPKPTANTLYFVFTQPGVRVVMGGSASCQAFCGYHNATAAGVFYAVMPYPNCNGCTGHSTAFDALTSTSSHELCEAITDPIPGLGWYDDANGEIGDICAWQTKKVGKYTVQLEWSNSANRCI